jgi:hypothetical protein
MSFPVFVLSNPISPIIAIDMYMYIYATPVTEAALKSVAVLHPKAAATLPTALTTACSLSSSVLLSYVRD